MFKRGAHLAARSMGQWLRPDSSGYIVKNRYPAEAAHGYESYSRHSCYNLQSCSMLALACETADDSIVERPAPSDIGGFIVQIDKAGLTPRYNNASSLEA